MPLKSWLYWNGNPSLAPWVQRLAALLLTLLPLPLTLDTLVEALEHPNQGVQALLWARLRRLRYACSRDRVCQHWQQTRAPQLTRFLLEQGWVAGYPEELRVLTLLLQNQGKTLSAHISRTSLPTLLAACDDPDPVIAERARQALFAIRRKDIQQALWSHARQTGHLLSLTALAQQGFIPEDENERALFWLLLGRWEDYDALDFDRRRLSALYLAADEALRARIREQIRQAGRTDFLPVLTGGESRLRAAALSPAETKLVLELLAGQEQWPALWELVPQVHTAWSVWTVERLLAAGWQPPTAEEQALLKALSELTQAGVLAVPDLIRRSQALLTQAAVVRAPGRVNAVAFAPQSPWLAAAIGTRRVVLWNYVEAKRAALLTHFAHAVYQVVFTPNEWLLCSERTQGTQTPVQLYLTRPGESPHILGQHNGLAAVTLVGETWAVSAGREGMLKLWDVSARKLLRQQEMHSWAQQLCPVDGQSVLFLGQAIRHLTLPDLKPIGWRRPKGRVKTAAVTSKDIVLGQHDGEVWLLDLAAMSHAPQRLLTSHPASVVGLAVLPRYNLLLSLDSQGSLRGFDLATWDQHLELDVHSGRVTGMQISPDGAFMALGTGETAFALWDLRLLELPQLFSIHLAQISPAEARRLRWLAERPTLDPAIQRALHFSALLLQHRGRYEIELETAAELAVGEFDIELEG